MKSIVKYTAPLFRGELPYRIIRAMMYDNESKSTGLDVDRYGRMYIISGPLADDVAALLVKTFGGVSEKVS